MNTDDSLQCYYFIFIHVYTILFYVAAFPFIQTTENGLKIIIIKCFAIHKLGSVDNLNFFNFVKLLLAMKFCNKKTEIKDASLIIKCKMYRQFVV
jgi:hypothetical protein